MIFLYTFLLLTDDSMCSTVRTALTYYTMYSASLSKHQNLSKLADSTVLISTAKKITSIVKFSSRLHMQFVTQNFGMEGAQTIRGSVKLFYKN